LRQPHHHAVRYVFIEKRIYCRERGWETAPGGGENWRRRTEPRGEPRPEAADRARWRRIAPIDLVPRLYRDANVSFHIPPLHNFPLHNLLHPEHPRSLYRHPRNVTHCDVIFLLLPCDVTLPREFPRAVNHLCPHNSSEPLG